MWHSNQLACFGNQSIICSKGSLKSCWSTRSTCASVPGRKTDIKDAEWIADLLQHGLLKARFIPNPEQRQLRDLTRCRTTLIQERSRHVNRLQKVLEDANLKLASVITDVMGKTGRTILHALVEGQDDPQRLADLAQGSVQSKREQLTLALHGRLKDHHRFL